MLKLEPSYTYAEALHLVNRVLEAAPLLPFTTIWVRYNNVPDKLRLLLYYVVVEGLFYNLDVVSRYVFHNNVYIFHLSTVAEVTLLTQTYRRLFSSIKIKKFIRISVVIFLIIAFADAAFINGLFADVNSYSQATGSVILVSLSLIHIIHISRSNLSLENQPEFFMSIAILIYFSYTIVTYVATNIIYNSGYDILTRIQLDRIVSGPDTLLFAVQMGLFAWMFSFFPLTVDPLRALPYWLHYSRWHTRPYKLLGNSTVLRWSTTAKD